MSEPDCAAEIHGLVYPPSFLQSLPLLLDRPHPQTPIRALSAEQFATIHFNHLTAHAPDNVLFPFLHGLESDNAAQNLFFRENCPGGQGDRFTFPRYRGLVWVVCEDDLPNRSLSRSRPRHQHDESGDFYDDNDDDDEFLSEESIEDLDMDVDVPETPAPGADVAEPSTDAQPTMETESHMHPVAHRPQPPPISTSLSSPPTLDYVRRPSNASSSTCTTTVSSSPFSNSTSATSLPTSSSPSPPLSHSSALEPPILTSTFRPSDLLRTEQDGTLMPEFLPPKVPAGISLRNFGIQVPVYATLSDIVIYSPLGLTPAALALAEKFKLAVELKLRRRTRNPGISIDNSVMYNVFVIDAEGEQLKQTVPNLVKRLEGNSDNPFPPNTVDFERREKDEMRELTKASEILTVSPLSNANPSAPLEPPNSEPHNERRRTATHWDPSVGQVFLGNSHDVPLIPPRTRGKKRAQNDTPREGDEEDEFDYRTNDPARGFGYDVCIECNLGCAGFPSLAYLRAAEEHIDELERAWALRMAHEAEAEGREGKTRVRPPPNASSVFHLRFPSSPLLSTFTMTQLMPYIHFLERLLQPWNGANQTQPTGSGKRRSIVQLASSASPPAVPTTSAAVSAPGMRHRASSTSSTSPLFLTSFRPAVRTRPLKILIYTADGYTDSSVLALCLLMAVRGLSLPEAYLELQVVKRRSFFVYAHDLELLRRVEAKLKEERTKGGSSLGRMVKGVRSGSYGWGFRALGEAARTHSAPVRSPALYTSTSNPSPAPGAPHTAENSIVRGRPRASTSPWLPGLFADHQAWFNDPRFDGSFPSRVLPFLYLGNLNHASNAYMLHALGITHVVSVGECALVPPSHLSATDPDAFVSPASCLSPTQPSSNAQFVAGKGPDGQGSLWIEEREGRIKVLDIKGVCDDGIDTLEPQLEPICQWIEKARAEGGEVLVHCRVGVSRSATVAIAYVMKHLGISLVDAYLIVRSRRLSVLIQPNMRLLYNLCGWEIKLAKERAGDDEDLLRAELARTLCWPYLAKEVHALNEKYLH